MNSERKARAISLIADALKLVAAEGYDSAAGALREAANTLEPVHAPGRAQHPFQRSPQRAEGLDSHDELVAVYDEPEDDLSRQCTSSQSPGQTGS